MRSKVSGLIALWARPSILAPMAPISRSRAAAATLGSCAFRVARNSAAIASSGARSDSRHPPCRSVSTRSVRSRTAPSSATMAFRGARSARLRVIAAISARIVLTSTMLTR